MSAHIQPSAARYEPSRLDELIAAQKLEHAEGVARHLLALEPDNAPALVAMARIEAARGHWEPALWQLKSVVAENPRDPEPVGYLAMVVAHRGDLEHALLLARRSLDLGGAVPPALCLVAAAALEEGAHEEALSLYGRALARCPSHAPAWVGIGRVRALCGQLAEAEDAYAEALALAPDDVDAWVELVELERKAGAHEAAAENIALALRAHPAHPALLALAHEGGAADPLSTATDDLRGRLRANDLAGAVRELAALVERHASDPRLLLARAEVAATIGKGDVATLVHDLVRTTRAAPNDWKLKRALGRLLLLPGPFHNPRLAAAHCEDAWRTSGEHPLAGLALVEAWLCCGKRALARALCARLTDGSHDDAEEARRLLAEIDSSC